MKKLKCPKCGNVMECNSAGIKPKTICDIVSKKINKKFNINTHTNAWRFYGI